jgi:hypothetical protein
MSFQDTDTLQDAIFRRIFADGARWLFLIGDPKQAIYGFRGADVFAYLQASAGAENGGSDAVILSEVEGPRRTTSDAVSAQGATKKHVASEATGFFDSVQSLKLPPLRSE